jgi:hypothetical protein
MMGLIETMRNKLMMYIKYNEYDIIGYDNTIYLMHILEALGLEDFKMIDESHYTFSFPAYIKITLNDIKLIYKGMLSKNIYIDIWSILRGTNRHTFNWVAKRVFREYIAYKNIPAEKRSDKKYVASYLNKNNIVFKYIRRENDKWVHKNFIKLFKEI